MRKKKRKNVSVKNELERDHLLSIFNPERVTQLENLVNLIKGENADQGYVANNGLKYM